MAQQKKKNVKRFLHSRHATKKQKTKDRSNNSGSRSVVSDPVDQLGPKMFPNVTRKSNLHIFNHPIYQLARPTVNRSICYSGTSVGFGCPSPSLEDARMPPDPQNFQNRPQAPSEPIHRGA